MSFFATLNTRAAVLVTSAIAFIATVTYFASPSVLEAFLVITGDGIVALLWIAGACGLGSMFLPRDRRIAPPLHVATAGGIGLGIFSLLGLALGLAGLLNRPVAIAFPVVGTALYAGRSLWRHRRWLASSPTLSFVPLKKWLVAPAGIGWLWLVPVLSLSMACVGAAVLPGLLWKPLDPHPYDVVSYHLQVPREWFELGRIVPLTHNVFSYFPFNIEMQYLLVMHATGGPWAGMYVCQFLNVGMTLLMLLAIVGIYGERPFTASVGQSAANRSPLIAAAIVSCVPWVTMLACVAYVETGFMLFATLSLAWVIRGFAVETTGRALAMGAPSSVATGTSLLSPLLVLRERVRVRVIFAFRSVFNARNHPHPGPPPEYRERAKCTGPLRALLLSGVFAGLAAGVKITAVPMLILPIALALPIVQWRKAPAKSIAVGVLTFLIAAAVVLSPWLIRNVLWAGNPIFPLAMNLLGRAHFTLAQVERFRVAHSPRPDQAGVFVRLKILWTGVLAHWQYGFVLLPVGALGAVRRTHVAVFLWINAAVVLIVWLGFTHLLPRFAISLVPIAAIALATVEWGRLKIAGVALALVSAACGLVATASTLHEQAGAIADNHLFGVEKLSFEVIDDVQKLDPGDTKSVALIGDAGAFLVQMPMSRLRYRCVFDLPANVPDPVDAWAGPGVRGNPGWLLAIHPAEIDRLHQTYRDVPALPPSLATPSNEPYVIPADTNR